MKIGIIGTRGIPNRYGGYEQFAGHAAPELVRRGHEVVVYNSSLHQFKEKEWNGVQLVKKYDPENKIGTTGQFIYDLNCILDARKKNFDIILQLGYTSSSIWSFLFPKRSAVITNMDGFEWKRQKYSRPVQRFLKQAEKWAAKNSDDLIADSVGMKQYLLEKYKRQSSFIAYSAELFTNADQRLIENRDLRPYNYDLVIARMEPENNIEPIVCAHQIVDSSKTLVVIGNYENKYGSFLKKKYESENIRFWGGIFDERLLNTLRYYSNFYFHGHSVGGTNPSLLEAMASYSLIVAHDNIFNRSVLGDDAFYFSTAEHISDILKQRLCKQDYQFWLNNNAEKIKNEYSLNNIINKLEHLFEHAILTHNKKRK